MRTHLPNEIMNCIFEFYNPYRIFYTQNVILALKSRHNFKILMKQLQRYRIYDRHGHWYFATDSILSS